jgi:hypothetical protein
MSIERLERSGAALKERCGEGNRPCLNWMESDEQDATAKVYTGGATRQTQDYFLIVGKKTF